MAIGFSRMQWLTRVVELLESHPEDLFLKGQLQDVTLGNAR